MSIKYKCSMFINKKSTLIKLKSNIFNFNNNSIKALKFYLINTIIFIIRSMGN